MKYLVTQEIESPSRVAKHIEITDFFFCLVYMAVIYALSPLVHEYLKIIYYIYSFLFALFLTSKSTFNKKRRNYESIILMLRHNINIYHPVYEKEEDDYFEEA